MLSPEMTEGPYWIDDDLTRRDITEDVDGLPLILRLSVVRATTCRPIKGADVELWHASPEGEYSGLDGSSGSRYLRGHQRSDAAGRVRFDTVLPGSYRYYKARGQADTSHAEDMIYGDGGARSTLRLRRRSGGRKGYVGRLELGVKT